MIQYGNTAPGSPVILLARVEDENGTLLTTATTSTVVAVVTDLNTLDTGDPVNLAPTDTVTALTVTDQWTTDSIGYNVAARLDGSHFPSGGTTYQVVLTITPTTATGGSHFNLVWEIQTDNVYAYYYPGGTS